MVARAKAGNPLRLCSKGRGNIAQLLGHVKRLLPSVGL